MSGKTSFLLAQPAGSRFVLFAKGRSAIFQCEADPRFAYCLYLPRSHPLEDLYRGKDISQRADRYPLTVLIHHAYLNGQSVRDDWASWAEENQTVLLCPIFPYSFNEDHTEFRDYYKLLKDPNGADPVRYDLLILDMIASASREWGYIETERFYLQGYSAGAQAACRFWFLHPEKVLAVAIGSPGLLPRLDSQPWPTGVGDTQDVFGIQFKEDSLRAAGTAVHLSLGELDTKARDAISPTRPQVLQDLEDDLKKVGVSYESVIVSGCGHEDMVPPRTLQQEFLAKQLRSRK